MASFTNLVKELLDWKDSLILRVAFQTFSCYLCGSCTYLLFDEELNKRFCLLIWSSLSKEQIYVLNGGQCFFDQHFLLTSWTLC